MNSLVHSAGSLRLQASMPFRTRHCSATRKAKALPAAVPVLGKQPRLWRRTATRMQRPAQVCRAASDNALVEMEEPDNAKEAIEQGLVFTRQQRWAEALSRFEAALNLPGTGIKRFRDKPAALSDTERMTALYNIACCQSHLQDARSGLVALAGCLELGYGDFQQLRSDPDLAFLRGDAKFEGLLQRFEPKNKSMFDFGGFFKK